MGQPIASTSVLVTIGAALSNGFNSAFKQTTDKLKTVGSAVAELSNKAQKLDALRASQAKLAQGLDTLAARQVKASAASEQAAARVVDLKAKIAAGGDATGKFALRLDAAEQAALRAGNRFASVDAELLKMKGEYSAVSAEATRFAAANGNVGASLQRLDALTARSNAARDAMAANREKRARYQSSMLGVIAMGAGIAGLVKHSAAVEEQRFPFRLALEMKGVPQEQIQKSIEQAREFARKNPATVGQVLDVELALNQRGMQASLAHQVSGFVANLASLTGEEGKVVGETVGSLFDSLGARMTGTAEQRVRHISDILGTLHFQGLDLDAESMKALTQAAVRLQIPFEAAVAAMGQLRQAGFDTGSAAQSTTMLLNNLSAGSKKFGFAIARDAAGNLDLARTITEIKASLTSLPGGTQAAADAMKAMAGNRGVAALTALIARTDRLAEAQKKLRDGAGFIDQATAKKMEEASQQLEQIRKNLSSIGATIGDALLPGFNAILKPLAPIGAALSRFTEHHKTLAKAMGTVVAAALTLSAALFGVGYVWTYVKIPALAFRLWLANLERQSFLTALGLRSVAAAERSAVSASAVAGVRSMFGAGAAESVAAGEAAGALYGGGVAAGAAKVAGRGWFARSFGGFLGRGAMVAGGAAVGEAAAAGTAGAGGAAAGVAAGGVAAGGVAAIAWPVVAVGAALAAAGLLVWKYWRPLGAFFSGLWEGITQGLKPIGDELRTAFEPLMPVLKTLKEWLGSLLDSTGLSGEGFRKAFVAGIFWGQRMGVVVGAVFVTLIRLITFAIQTVSTFGQMLVDLATGKPGDAMKHARDWWETSKGHGKAIGGAIAKIFESPDYAPAGVAAKKYEDRERQAAFEKALGPNRELLDQAQNQMIAVRDQISATGDATGELASKLRSLEVAIYGINAKARAAMPPEPPKATAPPSGLPAPWSKAKTVGSVAASLLFPAFVPKMAMGGLLTRATHFIGGEAGAEAVIPLQRPAAMLAIGAALASALGGAMPPLRSPAMSPSPVRVALMQMERARAPRAEAAGDIGGNVTVNNSITIHPAPGMDERKIGDICAQRIDQTIRDAQSKRRGAKHD